MSLGNVDNRENIVPSNQAMAGKELTNSIRKPFRSQAFNDLNNVMNNQQQTTPFKFGGSLNLTSSARKQPIALKYMMTPSKENKPFLQNTNRQKLDLSEQPQIKTIVEDDESNIIETYSKCTDNCEKSLDYVWSEMSVLPPEVIDKICDAAKNKTEECENYTNDDNNYEENDLMLFESIRQNLILDQSDLDPELGPAPIGIELPPSSDFWNDYLNNF